MTDKEINMDTRGKFKNGRKWAREWFADPTVFDGTHGEPEVLEVSRHPRAGNWLSVFIEELNARPTNRERVVEAARAVIAARSLGLRFEHLDVLRDALDAFDRPKAHDWSTEHRPVCRACGGTADTVDDHYRCPGRPHDWSPAESVCRGCGARHDTDPALASMSCPGLGERP